MVLATVLPVLVWVWFTTADDFLRFAVCVMLATVMLAVAVTELGCRTLWTFTMLQSSGNDAPLHYRLRTLPQFRLAGVMWAFLWLSVCFAAWRIDPGWFAVGPGLPIGEWLFGSLRFFPVPTAIGALFGLTLRGFIVGIALYVCLLAVALFALATGMIGAP